LLVRDQTVPSGIAIVRQAVSAALMTPVCGSPTDPRERAEAAVEALHGRRERAIENRATGADGQDLRRAELGDEEVAVRLHDDIAQVALDAQRPDRGIAAVGVERHELATRTCDVDVVADGVERDATRLGARIAARDLVAVDADRQQRSAATKADVDAARGVFDQAAGLVARVELEVFDRLAARQVHRHHAIAIGVGDDDAHAIIRDEHRAAGDRYAEWLGGLSAPAGSEEGQRQENLLHR
jgi:hypothetical protein